MYVWHSLFHTLPLDIYLLRSFDILQKEVAAKRQRLMELNRKESKKKTGGAIMSLIGETRGDEDYEPEGDVQSDDSGSVCDLLDHSKKVSNVAVTSDYYVDNVLICCL